MRIVVIGVVMTLAAVFAVMGKSGYIAPLSSGEVNGVPSSTSVTSLSADATNNDDMMTVTCVGDQYNSSLVMWLQAMRGQIQLGTPFGLGTFRDRGNWTELYNTDGSSYDIDQKMQDVIDGFDEQRLACINKDDKCDLATIVSMDTVDEDPSSTIAPCVETCISDRVALYEPTANVTDDYLKYCKDPVAIMLMEASSLAKSCLSNEYDCTEGGAHGCPFTNCYDCISECDEEEDVLGLAS
jgi:hypothetical protein